MLSIKTFSGLKLQRIFPQLLIITKKVNLYKIFFLHKHSHRKTQNIQKNVFSTGIKFGQTLNINKTFNLFFTKGIDKNRLKRISNRKLPDVQKTHHRIPLRSSDVFHILTTTYSYIFLSRIVSLRVYSVVMYW